MKTVAVALMLSLAASPAWAQSAEPSPQPSSHPGQQSEEQQDASRSDTAKLPVSLERIRRELALRPGPADDPFRLQYYVQVYGRLPAVAFLSERDLLTGGGVRYGSPTHQEILNQITPEEFRAPAADLTVLASLIAKWLEGKKKGAEK
jgi:hypothetical protein